MKTRVIVSVVSIIMFSCGSLFANADQEKSGWLSSCLQSLVNTTKSMYASISSAGSYVVNSCCSIGSSSPSSDTIAEPCCNEGRVYADLVALLESHAQSMQESAKAHLEALFAQQSALLEAQCQQYLEKQKKMHAHFYQQHEALKQLVEDKTDECILALDERLSGLLDASVMLEIDEKKLAQAGGDDLESTLKKHVDSRIGCLAKQYKNIEKKLGMISLASSHLASDESVDGHTLDYINRRVRAALQKRMGRTI